MSTLIHYFKILLLTAAAMVCFTFCNNTQEQLKEQGLLVVLDNSSCQEIAIDQIHLFIYNIDGKLFKEFSYSEADAVASDLLNLKPGYYSIVAIANADSKPADTATLTALHEWLVAQVMPDNKLLSGMTEVEILEDNKTVVTIALHRNSFSLPVLNARFVLPESELQDYSPTQAEIRAAEADYRLRCVVEICKAGTDDVILHKVLSPTFQEDGSYSIELQLSKADYDLHLWADYAKLDAPLDDTFYHTESLKALSIYKEAYTANTDAKDAAYGNEQNINMSDDGANIAMTLQRPLAKYRIIVDADEIEEYQRLRQTNPQQFPPIEELTVSVQYDAFFPSGFNVFGGNPNDAIEGLSYSKSLSYYDNSISELELGSDWIFVNGSASFVNATVSIIDKSGKVLSCIPGVQIDYRRNELSTINGKFLSSGVNSGGIQINTDWDGNIIVWF